MKKYNLRKTNEKGFTLVEILIATFIGGIVLLVLFTSFKAQQDNYLAQNEIVEIQQNQRYAMHKLTIEMRMAGYNPTGTDPTALLNTANESKFIKSASIGLFEFISDTNKTDGTIGADGKINKYTDPAPATPEIIAIGLECVSVTPGIDCIDINGDGSFDLDIDGIVSTPADLRKTTASSMPIVEDIERLEFLYTLKDGSKTLTPANTEDIRLVTISFLTRGTKPDRTYTNTQQYQQGSSREASISTPAWGATTPFNDNFHRRLLITSVKLRNIGLL